MKTPGLALRYLASRPLAALLNLLLLTLGLASITFVLLVRDQVERSFARDLAGIDLVVGAKGSPLQLILAGVFHIDVPPGNIPLADVQALARNPLVREVVPLALGDSFRTYRIVGSTPAYLQLYGAALAAGRAWQAPMEAVAGAHAARAIGLAPGSRFIGTHGLGEGGEAHGETPYVVTGVLAPCGCVLDRLLVTGVESVWQVHEKALAVDDADRKALEAEREVTVALVRYHSPLAAVTLPRFVNAQTGMQAAAPPIEVTRLMRLLGVGSEVLKGLGAVLLLTAGLSVFIALWSAVRERSADIAMLRMLGATPFRVAGLLLSEALWLAGAACVLGLAGGHALTEVAGAVLQSRQSLPLTGWAWAAGEGWVVAAALAVALLAAAIPAWGASRVDAARLLQTR